MPIWSVKKIALGERNSWIRSRITFSACLMVKPDEMIPRTTGLTDSQRSTS
jgi:hypothetical protein